MKISEYINRISFDKYKLYSRIIDYTKVYQFDNTSFSELINSENGHVINNSILTKDRIIDSTFKELKETSDSDFLNELVKDSSRRIYPSRKNVIFNTAILFEKNDIAIGGINLNLKERIAKTIDNEIIYLEHNQVETLIEKFANLEVSTNILRYPPYLITINKWRNYNFPIDYILQSIS